MQRVLVIGGGGMLGHRLVCDLSRTRSVVATVRDQGSADWLAGRTSAQVRCVETLEDSGALRRLVADIAPDVIVNCAGIVKRGTGQVSAADMVSVNGVLPHRLAGFAGEVGARFIQISTDCVFDGSAGPYDESMPAAPADLYGRSKLAGEVSGDGCLTLRTSMIGWELPPRSRGLLAWLTSREGTTVDGYGNALFSGVTTPELCAAIRNLIDHHPALSGLYHLAGPSIDKARLLTLLAARLDLPVTVRPVDRPVIDRRLDGSRLRAITGWDAASWDEQAAGLRAERDSALYADILKRAG